MCEEWGVSLQWRIAARAFWAYAIVFCGNAENDYPHVDAAMTLMDCAVSEIMTTKQSGNILVRIYESGNYMISGEKMQRFILVK